MDHEGSHAAPPSAGPRGPTGIAPGPPALPTFLGGGLPPPESRRRKTLIRGFAVFTIALLAGYLTWRGLDTINLGVWWLALPLFAVEIHNFTGLVLFTLALWERDGGTLAAPYDGDRYRIAVLIPTYNEPVEVLLPTVAAAVALGPAHETWVLDDGRRPAIRQLATALGASYLTRPDREHAKAGNLNHALSVVDAEIIAVLDADHVPSPAFLRNTLGYFDDDRVAVVQTPQDFYNFGSFEHESAEGKTPFYEEAVFYRVIGPAKNFWNAAFWCGTSALVRTKALREIGGVATDSVTEDILTTVRLNRRGWNAVYHNEVLARGLAPADAGQYLTQRNRWALGAMQVLRRENPLWSKGLSFGQRLSYATTLFAWFDSWRTFAYMLLPLAVIATGASPIDAPGSVYGPLFLTALAAQFVALRLLARGFYPPFLSLVFETLRMPSVLPATLALLRPGVGRFVVTAKGRAGLERERAPYPWLLTGLLVATVVGLVWATLTLAGLGPTRYLNPMPVIGAAVFAGVNLIVLATAVRRVRAHRFAGERRASERFDVRLPAYLGSLPCEVRDLSVTGVRIAFADTAAVSPEELQVLRCDVGNRAIELTCRLRIEYPADPGSVSWGAEFEPGQAAVVGELARTLFWGAQADAISAVPAAA